MDNELIILENTKLTTQDEETEIMHQIDAILEKSAQEKNPYIALNACKRVISVIRLSGIALAKILYETKRIWDQFKVGDDFTTVATAELGLNPATIDRYISVWSMYANKRIPEKFKEKISKRNMAEQIVIASAIKQGYEITDEHWEQIQKLPNSTAIRQYIREEVKNKEPKKGALEFVLHDDGTLVAWKDGKSYYVGYLEVTSKNEVVQAAIERIVYNNGVKRL